MTRTPEERFWEKVDMHGPDECWPWMATRNRGWYGRFFFTGKLMVAHRVAFFLFYGRWPSPQCLHSCDNPACCNPAHLWEGTQVDNIADMTKKGRRASFRGEKNGRVKLDPAAVRAIRAARGVLSGSALARLYGVSAVLISKIQLGKVWSHL